MRITAIYDNGGRFDRYAVITDKSDGARGLMALMLSSNPGDYNGASAWLGVLKSKDYSRLGERISFESLSERVQAHIVKRVFEEK